MMHAPITDGDVKPHREHEIDFHDAVLATVEHFEQRRGRERVRTPKRHAYAITTLPEPAHQIESVGCEPANAYGSWDARAPQRLDGSCMIIAAKRARHVAAKP